MQYTIVNENGVKSLTVFVPDKADFITVTEDAHSRFAEILVGALNDDESIYPLLDAAVTASTFLEPLTDRVSIANGRVYFDGDEVDNSLTKQIVRFISEGVEDWKPLVNFWEKVEQNPQEHSREQLFKFLNANDFSITPDGDIVAYKGMKTTDDPEVFTSTHEGVAYVDGERNEGYIPNYVGAIVTMPRNEVAGNPTVACSAGLHVATHKYASGFGQSVLEVHVNPRDVVSVPHESAEKVRCCRYEVIDVIKVAHKEVVVTPVDEPKIERAAGDDTVSHVAWNAALAESKKRKKGVRKIAESRGWVLVGDEPKDRESWVVPLTDNPPGEKTWAQILFKAQTVKKGPQKVSKQFGYELVGPDKKNRLHYDAINVEA